MKNMKKLIVFLFVIGRLLFPVSGSAQTPYINGNYDRNGNETFDGNLTATAWQNSYSCRYLQAVRCVDSANTAQWVGKDIGAWINAAYADLPTPEATKAAGVIYVFPKPDGSCYTDSTQILLNTNGKPAIVDFLGSCIDTSAARLTTAVVLDWGQAPGITGRFENLHLKGPCTTTACSGVTANGISLGPTNGLVGTILSNIYIGIAGSASGYLNGMLISSPGTYIDQCQSCFVYGNNIGVNIRGGAEGFKFIGGSISQNAVGVQTASNGAGIQWISTSFDDNTTYAFHRLSSTTFDTTCVECHFENAGLGALQVLQDDNSAGRAKFIGGDVLDDRTASTNAVLFVGGQNLYAEGVTVFSSGITITQVATLNSGGNGTFGFINAAPSAIRAITTNTTGRFWDRSVPSSSATMNVMRKNFIADSYLENSNAPAGADGEDRCYGDSTAHALRCSYNNGSFLKVPQVVASDRATMTTAAIAAGACGGTVTVSAPGVVTADTVAFSYAAAPGANPAQLVVSAWPTSGNVNFRYCNPTSGSVTPKAATLNWRVVR